MVYDYLNRPPKPPVVKREKGPTRVQQHFAEQMDVNNIVKRMESGYEVPLNRRIPQYGDVSEKPDFFRANQMVQEAMDMWDAMPRAVRSFCRNDPERFMEQITSPSKEFVELGEKEGIYVKKEVEPSGDKGNQGAGPVKSDGGNAQGNQGGVRPAKENG